MRTKAEFLALLEKYGLPAALFKIKERNDYGVETYIVVKAPRGLTLSSWGGDRLVYDYLYGAEIRDRGNIVNYDEYFAPIVEEYKMRCEHAKLLEEVAELRQKNAVLAEENAALRLLPGAPDYLAVKAHYEGLAKN